MRRMLRTFALIICFIFLFSNLSFAVNGSVSSKPDKNGFYVISTTNQLNLTGVTTILLPINFSKDIVTKKSLEKSGKIVTASITVDKNVLKITPAKKLDEKTTYTVKLTTKSNKKYVINIKTKAEIKKTVPTSNPTPKTPDDKNTDKSTDANPTSSSSTVTLKQDVDGYYILQSDDYLNTTSMSKITLPISIDSNSIEATSIEGDNKFISARIEIDNNILSISPLEDLVDGGTYTLRIFTIDNTKYSLTLTAYNIKSIDFSTNNLYKIPANPSKGYYYPYYLFVPMDADKNKYGRMIVEPNDSDISCDTFEYHDKKAKDVVQDNGGQGNLVASELSIPLLVPVFPRQSTNNAQIPFMQFLDRKSLTSKNIEMARPDLQLLAMIDDAQKLLASKGLKVDKKVFMTGYSSSAKFVQRFTALHPDEVKANFVGGIASNTIMPLKEYKGETLKYPVGVGDLKELTGSDFNVDEYKKVAQFMNMGDQDHNDATEWRDCFSEQEAQTIWRLFGRNQITERWNGTQDAIKSGGFDQSIQFNMYKGVGHEISKGSTVDIISFFTANNQDKPVVKIKTHDANDANANDEITEIIGD